MPPLDAPEDDPAELPYRRFGIPKLGFENYWNPILLSGQLGLRVLARRHRIEDVAFGQDADAGVLGVYHDGGADAPRGHHLCRLPQRVGGPDGQDKVGHAVSYFHE